MLTTNNTLITARKGANLTQLYAAKKIGVNVRTLRKWEKGISCPPEYFVDKMKVLYGVSDLEVITEEQRRKFRLS